MTTKAMPWFRMYTDFLNDPKMISLAFEDQRHYVGVLALKCSGTLDQECAPELLDRIVAQRLWIDHSTIREVKKRLLAAGLIGDDWQPLGWAKRQFRSDVDPTNAERQRRFKERKREEAAERKCGNAGNWSGNALSNAEVTPPDTDTEEDKEKGKPKAHKRAGSSSSTTLSAEKLMADGVDKRVALDWLTLRRAKRSPLTQTAWDAVKTESAKANLTPAQAVEYAVISSWTGFKAKWVEADLAERKKGGGNWWVSDELALAKANEVDVGPAHRHESRDAWHARIRTAIDNGGTPPAARQQPVTPTPSPQRVEPARTAMPEDTRAALRDLAKRNSAPKYLVGEAAQ